MSSAEPSTNHESRPLKTHEIIARQMRDQILRGELTPGQRLPPEDELTEQFGIARTTRAPKARSGARPERERYTPKSSAFTISATPP